MPNLLFCFSQMGGANALHPLLVEFGAPPFVTGRKLVTAALAAHGTDTVEFGEITQQGAALWMRRHRIDLLLTDTINMGRDPVEGTINRTLWAAAREADIPSIGYVDSWWAYDERFRLVTEKSPMVLPDRIALIDDYPKPEMIRLGYDEATMVTLGSPRFEELGRRARHANQSSFCSGAAQSRARWLVAPDDLLIVFSSQPFDAVYKTSDVWGFTEKTTLRDLVTALGALPTDTRRKINLMVALHPEEDENGMCAFLDTLACDFRVQVCKGPGTLEALAVCDLACGMFSILLTEAAILQRPVLTVQIDLKREDMAITNLVGATEPVRTRMQLAERLHVILTDPDERTRMIDRQRRFTIVENSRRLWLKEIDRLVGHHPQLERAIS